MTARRRRRSRCVPHATVSALRGKYDMVNIKLDKTGGLTEALALALPLYPRAAGAALGQTVYTEKGVTPLTDEAARPFAGLGALRDSLKDTDD